VPSAFNTSLTRVKFATTQNYNETQL
jgi:hypothetical protein